ncbi:MAG: hypothetical protein K8L97_18305 [Anaerolineae bacterium]|nr:hypothetical protein [Anaerolineae bacterium]
MRERFLKPLAAIGEICERLLTADEVLNLAQERFIESIATAAQIMTDSIISFPDTELENAGEVLSYEARSHLASIIGYAESLLDEFDGTLTAAQAEQIQSIRTHGTRMITLLARIVNSVES